MAETGRWELRKDREGVSICEICGRRESIEGMEGRRQGQSLREGAGKGG